MMRNAPAYGPPISSKKMVARILRTVGTQNFLSNKSLDHLISVTRLTNRREIG